MRGNVGRHSCRRDQAGFTFVETLAAMLFMAIVIPVVVQGLLLASRTGIAADRQRNATALADTKLTELVLTDDWRDGERDGDFGDDWPGYAWRLVEEDWEKNDALVLLSLEVSFEVQGRASSVTLSTVLEDAEVTGEVAADSEATEV